MIVPKSAMNLQVESQQGWAGSLGKVSLVSAMSAGLQVDYRDHSSRLLLAIARDSRTICPLQVQLVCASC